MMILAMMMVMTISAKAMSYNAAKNEALFLSDKMAYELNLTAAQYEAVYEINLDYLMSLNGHGDVFGIWWDRRNADLRYVLNSWQFDKYVALSHFYRPVAWKAGSWTFAVYAHYNRGHFYNDRPTVFVTYKGGHRSTYGRLQGKNRIHGSHYAHMHKPAVHHHAPAVHHPAPAPHHPKAPQSLDLWSLATIGTQECRSLWRTQIKAHVLPLHMPFKKGHGEFPKTEVPFYM